MHAFGAAMKSAAFILFASLTVPFVAFADDTQVHALIGADQMHVKATVSEVTWSSNLEDMQINDTRGEKSGTFILHCGGDAREYVMISIPTASDVWPHKAKIFTRRPMSSPSAATWKSMALSSSRRKWEINE